MSLLGNGTLANQGIPYYGGGGGGGSVPANLVASTLTLALNSTPTAYYGLSAGVQSGGNTFTTLTGPSTNVTFASVTTADANASTTGFLQMLCGVNSSQIGYGTTAGYLSRVVLDTSGVSISSIRSDNITVSSINGTAPSGGAVSTILTSRYAPQGGVGPVALASTPTVAGKWYNVAFNITDITAPVGIAPGDHVGILADTTVLGYFDLVQVSTCKALGQPIGYSVNGPAVAAGASMTIGAQTNAACAVSSFITCDFAGWVTKLN